ncbi:mannose-1-phosphate guanylyltransferase [Paenibacillus sp. F411]|uniref:sugar phosphate nucleotidyltransferase n=1 Tax=Paenibacillus sp. F411 TaxID=2820239 RepID=UPI001AAEE728|nr:sugar phosphate nucleotidyltransferase [Paenibacillus sp. F411]MBO2945345.1 mannose-1-phosphate guanylyltransferase [Paenibacillus sp. F411]
MKVVFMSGGTGSRLWPLSRSSVPKQFIPLFQDEAGNMEAILARNARLMLQKFSPDDVLVSSMAEHEEQISSCLPWGPRIIVEPERRDTFPSICLSSLYLLDELKLPEDELVCFCPADLYIEEDFVDLLAAMPQRLDWCQVNIALLGIEPMEPSGKYGYIVPQLETAHPAGPVYGISQFVEKPALDLASELISEGALWNSGVFMFRLSFMKQYVQSKGDPASYPACLASYSSLPAISFDYEVLEKTPDIVVVPFHGRWTDIGSLDRLVDTMGHPHFESKVYRRDTEAVTAMNLTDVPVVCIGVSNLMIVATDHGILVTSREACDDIKLLLAEQPEITEDPKP